MALARASLISIGFVAGIALMVSCGGGSTSTAVAAGGGSTPTEVIPVTSISSNVGDQITIGGKLYTIVQFAVPKFDTDEVYLVKYPYPADLTTGVANFRIDVSGAYPPMSPAYGANYSATLSGFEADITEYYSYQATMLVNNSGRSVTPSFSQSMTVAVKLGPETLVSLYMSDPFPQSANGTSPSRSADSTGLVPVYGPARVKADRAITRDNLRQLLAYVSLTKAP